MSSEPHPPPVASTAILIVDDNADNLRLVSFVLRKYGYDIREAVDAHSAMAAIRDRRPDLILMDIQLPGEDGLSLTRRIKADPALSDIVVVAFTSYAMKEDRFRALESGCDDYISKPVLPRTLPAKVAACLRQGPRSPSARSRGA